MSMPHQPMMPQPMPGPAMPQMPGMPGPAMPVGPAMPTAPSGSDVVNWQDLLNEAANAEGGTVLPVGDYDVQVATAEKKDTSTGKTMYKVKFQVASGPYAGKMIYNNFTISPENPNALRYFFQHMASMGLDASFFQQNPAPDLVAQALVGRQCRVTIAHRLYKQQLQMDVSAVQPFGGGPAIQPQMAPAPAALPTAPVVQPQPMAPAPVPQAPVPQPMVQPVMQPAPAPEQPQPAYVDPNQPGVGGYPPPAPPVAPVAPQPVAAPVPPPAPMAPPVADPNQPVAPPVMQAPVAPGTAPF